MKKHIPENPSMHYDAKAELFDFARNLRKKPTQAEAVLWEALKYKKLEGHKFRRQHPIGSYILDFYCHASRLSIEIDGGYHLAKEQALYDKNRTSDLESMSIKELRFENVQVLNHLGKVLAIILEQLAYNKSDE
jgi:very-short-patch-repair endonuclease